MNKDRPFCRLHRLWLLKYLLPWKKEGWKILAMFLKRLVFRIRAKQALKSQKIKSVILRALLQPSQKEMVVLWFFFPESFDDLLHLLRGKIVDSAPIQITRFQIFIGASGDDFPISLTKFVPIISAKVQGGMIPKKGNNSTIGNNFFNSAPPI
ncbi:MAG: hypothetical protein ACLVD4_03420 [Negativibacillus sp.]